MSFRMGMSFISVSMYKHENRVCAKRLSFGTPFRYAAEQLENSLQSSIGSGIIY